MNWTKKDEAIWEELQDWQQSLFEYEVTSLENSYDKWIDQAFTLLPEKLQIQLFEQLDSWLFHLNSLLRGSQLQAEAGKRVVAAAQSLDDRVDTFADMRNMQIGQLTFLAKQQASRHRLYSFVQGGMAGSGQAFMLGSDLFALLVINLRSIQLTAMSFGYDVQSPAGLLETLKVYNTATMPERIKMFGWQDLMADLQQGEEEFYYDLHEGITDQTWLDDSLKQMAKISLILILSKRTISNIPLFSMAIGAGVNYQTTRKITDFAIKYYQYKHLVEKYGDI